MTSKVKDITVSHNLLYGVFVTRKSYLTGLRRTVRAENVRMIALKALGERLPPDVIEDIVDQFSVHDRKVVDAAWEKASKASEEEVLKRFFPLFNNPPLGSPSAVTAVATRLQHEIMRWWPTYFARTQEQMTDVDTHLVHLSALPKCPNLHIPMLGASDASDDSELFGYARSVRYVVKEGTSRAIGFKHKDAGTSSAVSKIRTIYGSTHDGESSDTLIWHPYPETSNLWQWWTWLCKVFACLFAPNKSRHEAYLAQLQAKAQIKRLVQFTGLEDAIRNWNADELRKFVKILELEAVSDGASDPLTPTIHMQQGFSLG